MGPSPHRARPLWSQHLPLRSASFFVLPSFILHRVWRHTACGTAQNLAHWPRWFLASCWGWLLVAALANYQGLLCFSWARRLFCHMYRITPPIISASTSIFQSQSFIISLLPASFSFSSLGHRSISCGRCSYRWALQSSFIPLIFPPSLYPPFPWFSVTLPQSMVWTKSWGKKERSWIHRNTCWARCIQQTQLCRNLHI